MVNDQNPSGRGLEHIKVFAAQYFIYYSGYDIDGKRLTWLALTSPYMGMADFEWFLKQLEPLDKFIELNRQLYDSLLDFNLYPVA